MNWILMALFFGLVLWASSALWRGAERRKAPNRLGENGWPEPPAGPADHRRNDEE